MHYHIHERILPIHDQNIFEIMIVLILQLMYKIIEVLGLHQEVISQKSELFEPFPFVADFKQSISYPTNFAHKNTKDFHAIQTIKNLISISGSFTLDSKV